jgi:hypothetical protein
MVSPSKSRYALPHVDVHRRADIWVPQNLLNHLVGNFESVQIGREPTPECVPAAPSEVRFLKAGAGGTHVLRIVRTDKFKLDIVLMKGANRKEEHPTGPIQPFPT